MTPAQARAKLANAVKAGAILAGKAELPEIFAVMAAMQRSLQAANVAALDAALTAAKRIDLAPGRGDDVAALMGRVYSPRMVTGSEAVIPKGVDAVYRLSKTMMFRRGANNGGTVPVRKAEMTVTALFDVIDQSAIDSLTRMQLLWVGDFWGDVMQARIAAIAETAILGGFGGDDVRADLELAVRREMGAVPGGPMRAPGVVIPAGWTGTGDAYWSMVASNATTVARSAGAIRSFEELQITTLEIRNPMDEKSCSRCAKLDGKTFTVKQARTQLDQMVNARTKNDVKAAAPWLSASALTRVIGDKTGAAASEALAGSGICLPPYHGLCRCAIDVSVQSADLTQGDVLPPGSSGDRGSE